MFLDEELEQIHAQENLDIKAKTLQMLKAMIGRLPNPEEVDKMSSTDVLNTIKRIDNGWKLFCKRHPEYSEMGWRDWVLRSDVDNGKFKKALGW